MKELYSTPELNFIEFSIKGDVLTVSDPEPSIPSGGGGANPENPFDNLIP